MPTTRHGTLVADTVTTETLDGDYAHAAVFNRDTSADIWVRLDKQADPAVEADDSYVVPAGMRRVFEVTTAGATEVRLLSTGTPKYELEAS